MKLTVIGSGNMGRALIRGFVTGGVLKGSEVYVYDIITEAARKTAEEYGINVSDDPNKDVRDSDYVLMAVKPQHFDDTLKALRDDIGENTVVLSIAAAVTTERIDGILRGRKFVRIMPNTPAQVGSGVSAVCPVGLDEEQTEFVKKLFETCGIVIICDEPTLDAIGCVSGTGPAYVMLFIEAMSDAAVSLGIKRADALKIAAATVAGSGKLCLDTGIHPAVLKDQVTSPAGTTIEGVMALEENGLRNAVIKSVVAAAEKTRKMQGK